LCDRHLKISANGAHYSSIYAGFLPLLTVRIRQYNLLLLSGAFYGAVASTYYQLNIEKNAQHKSKLTGEEWMEELLAGHPKESETTWERGLSSMGRHSYLQSLSKQLT
jgi:hypothetical protein